MSRTVHSRYWRITGLLSGAIFLILLYIAYVSPSALHVWDDTVALAVLPFQTVGTIALFRGITELGDGIALAVVAIGVFYLFHLSRTNMIRLALLMSGTYLSMVLVKSFVGRMRPEALPWLDPFSGFAFPSGHAALTTALYGFIAVLAYRRSHTPLARVLSIVLPLFVILAIGGSRILLNAHYASDVIGGFFLGLTWLSLILMLRKASPRR